MDSLPNETIQDILVSLDVSDVIAFCSTNHTYLEFILDRGFWRYYDKYPNVDNANQRELKYMIKYNLSRSIDLLLERYPLYIDIPSGKKVGEMLTRLVDHRNIETAHKLLSVFDSDRACGYFLVALFLNGYEPKVYDTVSASSLYEAVLRIGELPNSREILRGFVSSFSGFEDKVLDAVRRWKSYVPTSEIKRMLKEIRS